MGPTPLSACNFLEKLTDSDILVTVRCECGKRLGDVKGLFRLKCSNKPQHVKHGCKNLIMSGFTHYKEVIIDKVEPEA